MGRVLRLLAGFIPDVRRARLHRIGRFAHPFAGLGGHAAPFVAVLAGREIVFSDPAELDWQDLLEIGDPVDFLRYVVSKEDREFIHKQKLAAFKFNRLMEAFMTYYELDEKLEQARREQRRALR